MLSKNRKITLGTKEWADSNINCYYGCSNNCRYCYAKKMAIRFKRSTAHSWRIMIPNYHSIEKNYKKRKGRIMFPTSHDITPESLKNCLKVLNKLLIAKNRVLITTKPSFNCIKEICDIFNNQNELIQFRFTITSINNNILDFWEPNAPKFEERYKSLKLAFKKDFKTSISIEPFLDLNPFILVDKLIPYVTESIWIGKINYYNISQLNDKNRYFYEIINKTKQKDYLLKIVEVSKNYEGKIRIKDSIYNYLKIKNYIS